MSIRPSLNVTGNIPVIGSSQNPGVTVDGMSTKSISPVKRELFVAPRVNVPPGAEDPAFWSLMRLSTGKHEARSMNYDTNVVPCEIE